jgi:hypothetical protein
MLLFSNRIFSLEAVSQLDLKNKGWTIEKLNSSFIRANYPDWTCSKLVDWLLEGTIHFILCQGLHSNMMNLWGTTKCYEQTLRLEFHPGFPSGNKLRCPAFNGFKWHYLAALHDMCLPTFKVLLNVAPDIAETNMIEAERYHLILHIINTQLFLTFVSGSFKIII